MIVSFTVVSLIRAHDEVYLIQVLVIKLVYDLWQFEWLSLGTLVSSTDKADHHDVAVEWLSLGTLVSSTDKADHHDVAVEWFSLGTLVSSTDKADHQTELKYC